jgi:hypothetical protein
MNLRNPIPPFFIRPRNTVIQIIFTTLFAYAFILLYHPFGSDSWFEINEGQFAFYAGFVVVLGMLVVIISRVIMSRIRRRYTITIYGYALMIALEVLAMTGFYMMIEKVFLKDPRFWFEAYYTAILNTSLIVLIPYLISLLYFAWEEKKRQFERVLKQKSQQNKPRFVPFRDENGEIRLTVKLDELLYLEANENYVFIHYIDQEKHGRFLLRSSLKKMEEELSGLPMVRCHRSYMINILRVKLIRNNKGSWSALMDSPESTEIPVTETYRHRVIQMIEN